MKDSPKRKFLHKKPEKEDYLVIILAGILICIILIPTSKKTDISDTKKSSISEENKCSTEYSEAYGEYMRDEQKYELQWEKKLQESLRGVEGVGKVKVLVSVRESYSSVTEKEESMRSVETTESDTDGRNSLSSQKETEEQVVYAEDESGQNTPFIVKRIAPAVEGVVVIAEGADNFLVKQNIIHAIEVLFGMDSNNIAVVKMKSDK